MPRATYMYSFEVRPERSADFAEWARATGAPFWISRPGLLSYRTFRVQSGAGTNLAMAEFDSAEALGQMFDTSEWAAVLADFQSYVSDIHSWVLSPEATGEQPLRPPGVAAN